MAFDRIRHAMNAGKRWAKAKLKGGVEITPQSVEKYNHRKMQYLFLTSALEVLLERESRETKPKTAA